MSRTGLVLGAGGILGSAWMTGALPAVQERIGRPLGELDLVLGTSAGAVLGAALRCGMSVDELLVHQGGASPAAIADLRSDHLGGDLPDMRTIERESGDGRPPLPLPWIGSPRLVARTVTHPRTVNPVIAASALLPAGRGRLGSLVRLVAALQARLGVTHDGWVPGAPLWVVAVDYDSGRRIVFGRDGGPPSTVAEAVLASCSIPGWFAPQVIDGRRYVDGGVASSTSLGLLARPGAPPLDEVYVLAPLASHAYDRPWDPIAGVERGVRCLLTRWLDAEVQAVRAAGVRVTVLTPGPEDLAAMGGNLMNPRRRTRVLEVSLRTSAAALESAVDEGARAA
jgi:NTE family protein